MSLYPVDEEMVMICRIMEFAMKEFPQNPIETTFIVANNMKWKQVANIAEYAGSDICVIDISCKSPPSLDNPPYSKCGTRNTKVNLLVRVFRNRRFSQ